MAHALTVLACMAPLRVRVFRKAAPLLTICHSDMSTCQLQLIFVLLPCRYTEIFFFISVRSGLEVVQQSRGLGLCIRFLLLVDDTTLWLVCTCTAENTVTH